MISTAAWLDATIAGRGVEVPCGTCTACCRSAYFIHVEPDEAAALTAIPKELQFPAPGRPAGHVVLGFDERGHCPMLVDDRCSIYEVRPRTCRVYDCRVYAVAGLDPEDDDKPHVAVRVRQWPVADDEAGAAVRRAVAFLRSHPEVFTSGTLPPTSMALALAAIHTHALFLTDEDPTTDTVRAALHPELA